jgi:hypothetical protein
LLGGQQPLGLSGRCQHDEVGTVLERHECRRTLSNRLRIDWFSSPSFSELLSSTLHIALGLLVCLLDLLCQRLELRYLIVGEIESLTTLQQPDRIVNRFLTHPACHLRHLLSRSLHLSHPLVHHWPTSAR